MSSEKKLTAVEFHRQMAVELFNLIWNLLDKDDRSQAKVDQMIHFSQLADIRE